MVPRVYATVLEPPTVLLGRNSFDRSSIILSCAPRHSILMPPISKGLAFGQQDGELEF